MGNNLTHSGDILKSNETRENNFDLLRFGLALLVILSHCYVILYGKLADVEPGMIFTKNQTDIGGIAVAFFFIISGHLILQSYLRSPDTGDYLRKRFLRIYPGYFVAFALSLFVFGTLGAIGGSVRNYLSGIDAQRVLLNLATLQKPVGGPSFSWLPMQSMLNESLWTIEYEFSCYLLLPLIFLTSHTVQKSRVAIWFGLAYVMMAVQHFFPLLITKRLFPISLLYVIDPVLLPKLSAYFLSGCGFYLYRDYIKQSAVLAVLALAITIAASRWLNALDLVLPFTGGYLLFYMAFHPRLKFSGFAKKGDLSYGMYLYAWPVQQLITYALFRHLTPLRLFILTVPATYVLAWLSWHLVEKSFPEVKAVAGRKGSGSSLGVSEER